MCLLKAVLDGQKKLDRVKVLIALEIAKTEGPERNLAGSYSHFSSKNRRLGHLTLN
jgi:hypothetical protein